MKKILNILAVSAFVGASASVCAASPLIPIDGLGEKAGVYGLLSASVAYNDNLYLRSSDKKGDCVLTVSPGAEFVTGTEGVQTFSVRFVENLSLYMDQTENNAQLENIDATYSYGRADSRLRATVAAGFHHNQSNSSRDNRDDIMIRTYSYYGRAIASYRLSESGKITARTGFKWDGLVYDNQKNSYNDRETYAVPVYLYYAVSPKLDVGLTYEYRYVDMSSNALNRAMGLTPGVQQVHFFGLSAEGALIPESEKLTVKGRIGYTQSDYSRRTFGSAEDSSTMGMRVTFGYEATPKLNTTLTLNRDFEIAGNASGITTTGVELGASYKVADTDRWTVNGSLAYRLDDYQGVTREDDVYTLGAGVAYQINDYLQASANYYLSLDDSNQSGMNYSNNIVTLGLTLRY